jgi:hypothetical protein
MRLLRPFSILIAPRRTLSSIALQPAWVAAFIVLSLLSISLSVMMHPFVVSSTLAHLPASASVEEKAFVAQRLRDDLPMRCLFLPIRLLVGWAAFAYVLFLVSKAITPAAGLHFVKIFSLEVHAEGVSRLAQLSSLVRLLLSHDASATIPLRVPLSAADLFPTSGIVGFSLLNSINFFTLWYGILLTLGLSLQSELPLKKSLAVVVVAFLVYLLFHTGTTLFLHNTLHLLI